MKYWLLLSLFLNVGTLTLALSNRDVIVTIVNAMDNVATEIERTIEEVDNGRLEED